MRCKIKKKMLLIKDLSNSPWRCCKLRIDKDKELITCCWNKTFQILLDAAENREPIKTDLITLGSTERKTAKKRWKTLQLFPKNNLLKLRRLFKERQKPKLQLMDRWSGLQYNILLPSTLATRRIDGFGRWIQPIYILCVPFILLYRNQVTIMEASTDPLGKVDVQEG